MNCIKCNTQVPDGAKFCPNCGALTAAARSNKSFCANCGLELPKGAKFCTVCGAAVVGAANVEVKPSDVLAPVTPTEPVSISPVVEPISPAVEPISPAVEAITPGDIIGGVAAVTANAEPAYSVPVSSEETVMPAISSDDAEARGSAPTIFEQIEFGYVAEGPAVSEGPVLSETPVMPETPVITEAPFMPEAPVIAETPVIAEAPVMPEYNASAPTGYSAAAASYSAPTAAPTYTAPVNNPMNNQFGNYGMSAAAVATKPIKKKSVLKPILISLGAIIGAALIAAGVLFFVNKSLLFNIVLGNSGYAAMVEGDSIKSVTDKIDVTAMSEGIKTATNAYASAMIAASKGYSGITTTSASSVGMSSVYSTSLDAKSLVTSMAELMRKTYGTNYAKSTFDFSAELTDTGASLLMNQTHISKKDIDEILKFINEMDFSADVTADGKAIETGMEFTSNGLKLNAKIIVADDGNAYFVLPFASEKAFMINLGSGYSAAPGTVTNVSLEIEGKELKRIIDKLVSIYVDVYKSGEITVKDGEITAAGASAKGKYITAKLNGSKFTEMLKRTGEALAEDSYFCGQFAKFLSDCGMPVTGEQMKSTFKSMFNMINIPDDYALIVETVTDNSCRVLGKKVSFIASNKTVMAIAAVGSFDLSTKTGNTAALSIDANEKTVISALVEKASDTDGTITVNAYANDSTVSAKVKYSNVKETKFNGTDTFEGDFEVSLVLPADFTAENATAEQLAILGSMKIGASVKIENGNTLKETFFFEIPQYGKFSASAVVSGEERPNGVSIPSDVIDITDIQNLPSDQIDENITKEMISFLKDLRNAINKQNAGDIGNKLVEALDELIDVAENGPSADSSEISEFLTQVMNDKSDIMMFDEMFNNENEELTEKAEALVTKYDAFLSMVSGKSFDMTEKEFETYKNTFATLTAEKDALQAEYKAACGPQNPVIGAGSRAEDIDFTTLDFKTLALTLAEYESRFTSAVYQVEMLFNANANITNLAKEATELYEKAVEDFENLYDVYQAGSLNLSLLRKSRKSAQALAFAVEELEQAIASSV